MELKNIYRDIIIEHFQNPRNNILKGYKETRLRNPSCGDDVTVECLVEGNNIKEVNFNGKGCSICCASASIMTDTLKNKQKDKALEIINNYYQMIKGENFNKDILEEAIVFENIKDFPARTKCAVISRNAIEELINNDK